MVYYTIWFYDVNHEAPAPGPRPAVRRLKNLIDRGRYNDRLQPMRTAAIGVRPSTMWSKALSSRSSSFIPRLHHALLAIGLIAGLPACATRDATPAHVERADAVSLEGWQAETFALPPGFAPELPTGTESLRFAPGWRDPAAEGFWSYAFVMWIDEPAPGAARIDDLLEKYYNGLMASFAAGKNKDISSTPARVEVVRTAPNRYEARMHLIDAFATFEPIDLRILVDTAAETDARATLRIRVSPQPKEDAIWRSLEAAIASILSPDVQSPP